MASPHRVIKRRHGMALRASTQGARLPWRSLPAEIRLTILETIAQQKHRGWASLASVCKDWQHVIEKQNFRLLKLQVSCLDGFERLVIRQRHLVQNIQLNIELPRYSCHCCTRGPANAPGRTQRLDCCRGNLEAIPRPHHLEAAARERLDARAQHAVSQRLGALVQEFLFRIRC